MRSSSVVTGGGPAPLLAHGESGGLRHLSPLSCHSWTRREIVYAGSLEATDLDPPAPRGLAVAGHLLDAGGRPPIKGRDRRKGAMATAGCDPRRIPSPAVGFRREGAFDRTRKGM
ncbi:hypothetical protein OPV22_030397 [Ensete ventricosum]|uniref:Uncharacterized protein n=1 Tax=Ensete ventricosum TaxID=4639 RepID=A0AAV8Q8W4_ENSVE|nr:hypothetical protein OPV22_030397 [Ensete ventricosum]